MKMYRTTIAVLAVFAVALSAGCSRKVTAYSIAKDEAQAADVRAKIAQDRADKAQHRLEDELAATPDWFTHPPRPDDTGMYAVGSGEADSLEIAINKARLRAEFGLAKLSKKELTGSERDFARDSGDTTILRYERLIDSIVQATIVCEESVKQNVAAIDGRVHVWVLLKQPYDEFNRVIQEQRAKTNDETIKAAFDDLERRIDKRHAQAVAETASHAAAPASTPAKNPATGG